MERGRRNEQLEDEIIRSLRREKRVTARVAAVWTWVAAGFAIVLGVELVRVLLRSLE